MSAAACCTQQIFILLLAALPSVIDCSQYAVRVHKLEELKQLRTSVECTSERRKEHDVCIFSNLILHDGQFYAVTEDNSTELRSIHVGLRFDEPGNNQWMQPIAVKPDELPFEWASVRKFQVKGAVVNYIPAWANILHLMGEYMPSLHAVACQHLKLCGFADRVHTMLVNTNPDVPGSSTWGLGVTDAFKCMSIRPILWVHHADVKQMVFVLSRAVVGYGNSCRVDHMQCIGDDSSIGFGRRPAPPDLMDSWVERMNECMGLNATAVASVDEPRVLFIDRDFKHGRSFLNSAELMHVVRRKWGHKADIKHVKLEDLPLKPQAHVFHSASVIIMMHGAALANWIFVPRKAVLIHVVPQPWYYDLEKYAEAMVSAFSSQEWLLLQVTNSDPNRLVFMMDKLMASEEYKAMTPEHKVSLLESKRCPPESDSGVPLSVCAFHWLHSGTHLMLDPKQLAAALDEASKQLTIKFNLNHLLFEKV